MNPALLMLAAKYGPRMIQLIAKQMPKINKVKVGTGFKKTMARIQSHSGLKRVSSQMRANADKLVKKYPNLFNSTDKFVNKGNAMRLDQAFKRYKTNVKWPEPRVWKNTYK